MISKNVGFTQEQLDKMKMYVQLFPGQYWSANEFIRQAVELLFERLQLEEEALHTMTQERPL